MHAWLFCAKSSDFIIHACMIYRMGVYEMLIHVYTCGHECTQIQSVVVSHITIIVEQPARMNKDNYNIITS